LNIIPQQGASYKYYFKHNFALSDLRKLENSYQNLPKMSVIFNGNLAFLHIAFLMPEML